MTDENKKNQSEEFEREPVPKSKLKGWKSFLGMYAGEHAAGTEFMIGGRGNDYCICYCCWDSF